MAIVLEKYIVMERISFPHNIPYMHQVDDRKMGHAAKTR